MDKWTFFCRLNWKIAEVDSNILRVLPVESQILPNEVQVK